MAVVYRTDMRTLGGPAGRFVALPGIVVIGGLGSAAPGWAEPTPAGWVEAGPLAADYLEFP